MFSRPVLVVACWALIVGGCASKSSSSHESLRGRMVSSCVDASPAGVASPTETCTCASDELLTQYTDAEINAMDQQAMVSAIADAITGCRF